MTDDVNTGEGRTFDAACLEAITKRRKAGYADGAVIDRHVITFKYGPIRIGGISGGLDMCEDPDGRGVLWHIVRVRSS